MSRALFVPLALPVVVLAAGSSLAQAPAKPVTAVGSVELKDPAGDMNPISTSSGQEPPLDVILLSIKSDGTRLTLAATLSGPPGKFATAPITVYIDADNNPSTGIKGRGDAPGGFEYEAKLALCIKYENGSEACSGGSTASAPKERYGAIELTRFKGATEYDAHDTVLDSMGFPGRKASAKVPVTGNVVSGSLDYADIGAKPGAKLRLAALETGGSPKDGSGAFPEVLLTLK